MNNQNLIIYQIDTLYEILKELEQDLNLNIIKIENEKSLINTTRELENYLIVLEKKIALIKNQFLFSGYPIKISKLLERINIEFLKKQFSEQSKLYINNYFLNLNTREISQNDIKLKLTEKEVNLILYLSKTNTPININELENNVWKFKSNTETHTVETHIYRLRKKIFNLFKDKDFIISKKNGYLINKP